MRRRDANGSSGAGHSCSPLVRDPMMGGITHPTAGYRLRIHAAALFLLGFSTPALPADRVLSREVVDGIELVTACYGGIRTPGSFGERFRQLEKLPASTVRSFSPFPTEIHGAIHFQMISAGRNSEDRPEVAVIFRSMSNEQCAHFITFPESLDGPIHLLNARQPASWMSNQKDDRSVYFRSMQRKCNAKSRSSDFSIAFCSLIYEATPNSQSFVPNAGSVEIGLKSRVSEFLIRAGSEVFSVTTIADRLFFSKSTK